MDETAYTLRQHLDSTLEEYVSFQRQKFIERVEKGTHLPKFLVKLLAGRSINKAADEMIPEFELTWKMNQKARDMGIII